jgi:hypothetical protein
MDDPQGYRARSSRNLPWYAWIRSGSPPGRLAIKPQPMPRNKEGDEAESLARTLVSSVSGQEGGEAHPPPRRPEDHREAAEMCPCWATP